MSDSVVLREAGAADAFAIAKVLVDSWRTTYRGIVPDDYLANLSYRHQVDRWRRILSRTDAGDFTYVVEDGNGEIVGGGPDRSGDPTFKGELYAIYLLESHQRKGIGRRLTQRVVERLAHAGFDSMLAQVFKDNPACRFYEALRGQQLRIEPYEIGGVTLDLVTYGWPDTRVISASR